MRSILVIMLVVLIVLCGIVFELGRDVADTGVVIKEIREKQQQISREIAFTDEAIKAISERLEDLKRQQLKLSKDVAKIPIETKVQETQEMVGGEVVNNTDGVKFSLASFNNAYFQLKDRLILRQMNEECEMEVAALNTKVELQVQQIMTLESINKELEKSIKITKKRSRWENLAWGVGGAIISMAIVGGLRR